MNMAEEAYEAYRRHTGGKSLATERPIPDWIELTKDIKDAWTVSTAWVVGLYSGQGAHEHRLHEQIRRRDSVMREAINLIENDPEYADQTAMSAAVLLMRAVVDRGTS